MGTPFISFLGPSGLHGYDRKLSCFEQKPGTVPKTFLDAMEVRESVFVEEQNVPLENEFDADDGRSCHWVVYASVNTIIQPEVKDAKGNIVIRKRSETKSLPIGTIRLVPFPHPAHPEPDTNYDPEREFGQPPPYIIDRETSFHNGKEPYIKLGRIAVLKEFRNGGIARILVDDAMQWITEHYNYFDPSITNRGMKAVNAVKGGSDKPLWAGLLCVHAQQDVVPTWERFGFKIDEKMGTWDEEGIKHVGMFQRLKLQRTINFR